MKFLDECNIKVSGGKGGNGMISFRKEYRVDKGGPDGGDGGHGGSIYFVGDSGMNTLMPLKYQKHINGNDGENGKRKKMYGVKGEDIYVKVPIGTLVYNGQNLLVDITKPQKYLIVKGGKGGRGNVKFKTARNTAPRLSENGDPGLKYDLTLILKVLADVGFVGKPSAGKSTLLSKISNAKPKIADYEFTTLTPQLGIVIVDAEKSFVGADLPGLIQGASRGKGLGFEFLKHIERCRVIAHVIDFGSKNKDPIEDYKVIQNELKTYNLGLEKKPQIIVANKLDKSKNFQYNFKKFQDLYKSLEVIQISALKEEGIARLKFALHELYKNAAPLEQKIKPTEITLTLKEKVIVSNPFQGFFDLKGTEVERIYNKIPLNSWENFQRFNKLMKDINVWKRLGEKGIKDGDTVRIFGYEFQWFSKDF